MENRNLQYNKRVKVPLILIFSVNTNHESVAYRSFSPSTFEARGARKVTTGINCSRTTCPRPGLISRGLVARPLHGTGGRGATHLDAGKSCQGCGTKRRR